jgi:hypothetical protein
MVVAAHDLSPIGCMAFTPIREPTAAGRSRKGKQSRIP